MKGQYKMNLIEKDIETKINDLAERNESLKDDLRKIEVKQAVGVKVMAFPLDR